MNTTAKIADPRVMTVEVTDDESIAHLVDGRTISMLLVWSWRLASALGSSDNIGKSLATGRLCAGRTLTRILGWKACWTGCRPIVPEDMLGPTNNKHKRSYMICTMSAYYHHGGCGYIRPVIRQTAKQLPAAHMIGVRQTDKTCKGLIALQKLHSDLNSDILDPIQT